MFKHGMKMIKNKKRINFGNISKLLLGFLLFFAFFGLLNQTVQAADSDTAYASFSRNIGSCPRQGQPGRVECVIKVAKKYSDVYCAGKTNRDACNNDWKNGFLVWFSKQPDQDALKNQIGYTAFDTGNSECDGIGSDPPNCTLPYNADQCADGISRPSFCDIPNLDTAGITDPTANIPEENCNEQVQNEQAKCKMVTDCNEDTLNESNCGIIKYLLTFINLLSAMVGITVVIVIIIAGIQYTTSAGDPNAAAAAKKRISNAILALVTFAIMYSFLQWIVPGGVF